MPGQAGLEQSLDRTAGEVDAALKVAAAVVRELKKAKSGLAAGQVRELRRAMDNAATAAGDLAGSAEQARQSFDLDEQEYLSSGAYTKELLAAAAQRDVAMFEADERLLCYPSLIRILPGDAALEIDRRREKRLRPSALVERLAAAQGQPPRFRPEPFLESLVAGYDLVVARENKTVGAVVKLVEVWAVLTLLPGQQRDYTKPEFARDLYLLDQSGVSAAKDGRGLRWNASSGTRGSGTLTTVARSGQQQLYWGISFTGGQA